MEQWAGAGQNSSEHGSIRTVYESDVLILLVIECMTCSICEHQSEEGVHIEKREIGGDAGQIFRATMRLMTTSRINQIIAIFHLRLKS